MIKSYKEHGLDGIRSKRRNAGRKPKISSVQNKQLIKEIISKSPGTFGYLKITWSIRLLAAYLTTILGINVSPMQTWRIVHYPVKQILQSIYHGYSLDILNSMRKLIKYGLKDS